ncbi:hypothetical protein KJ359_004330 [Pestalotiopsis sp. 9143b]|nr:hypothetical protein KJ359_004330 [Pestalotiopsis sp. 9143b]
MAIMKRKRSESELSFSSSSTGSAFNSPTRTGAAAFGLSNDCELTSPLRRLMAAPSHLPSRTMKRFRDDRPSQDEIHQRTLHMLFEAAQRPETQASADHASSPPSLSHEHQHQYQPRNGHAPQDAKPVAHQVSLHSFWNLPNAQSLSAAASAAMPSPPVDASIYAPSDCEDCGRLLRGGDDVDVDDDVMMDVDGAGDRGGFGAGRGDVQTGCAGCGKHVCSHCSITNMGDRRRCLGCADTGATRKGWVGGGGGLQQWLPESSSNSGRLGIF